jgi:hypothetical protein
MLPGPRGLPLPLGNWGPPRWSEISALAVWEISTLNSNVSPRSFDRDINRVFCRLLWTGLFSLLRSPADKKKFIDVFNFIS